MTKKDTNIAKGIAAILMLIHHLFLPSNNPSMEQYGMLYRWPLTSGLELYYLAGMGKVCVAIFVFLSAYGTVRSYINRKISPEDPSQIAVHTVRRYVSLLLSFQLVFIIAVVAQYVGSKVFPNTSIQPLSTIYGSLSLKSLGYIGLDFMGGGSYLLQTPTLNITWWYMPFAFFLITAIPILATGYRKIGCLFVLFIFFLCQYISMDSSFGIYLPIAAVGVLVAYSGIFERLSASFNTAYIGKKVWVLFLSILLVVFAGGIRIAVRDETKLWSLADSFFVVALCILITLGIGRIPILSSVMAWIGTHSMNIFMTHTFLYYYWFPDHLIPMRYPIRILLVLLGETLLLSVAISFIAKKLQLSKWADKIAHCLVAYGGLSQKEESETNV